MLGLKLNYVSKRGHWKIQIVYFMNLNVLCMTWDLQCKNHDVYEIQAISDLEPPNKDI